MDYKIRSRPRCIVLLFKDSKTLCSMVLYTHKNINKSIKRLTKFVFFLSSVSATNNTTCIHHLVKNDMVTMISLLSMQCMQSNAKRFTDLISHTSCTDRWGGKEQAWATKVRKCSGRLVAQSIERRALEVEVHGSKPVLGTWWRGRISPVPLKTSL